MRLDGIRSKLGFTVVFSAFQMLAGALGSDRGQAGIIVGAVVVAMTMLQIRATLLPPACVRCGPVS